MKQAAAQGVGQGLMGVASSMFGSGLVGGAGKAAGAAAGAGGGGGIGFDSFLQAQLARKKRGN